MRLIRRWLIYRRLLKELVDAGGPALADIGVCRCAVRDFAWHCAEIEVDRAANARTG